MSSRWSKILGSITGPRAVSLDAFLIGTPFWVFGFVFNEGASFDSLNSALQVLSIGLAGQAVMGLVLWMGHLTILRSRTQRNVALWAVVTTWSLSALARWAILVGGLQFFDLPDEIPALTRALTSLVVVNLGYAFAAYGLEAYDRFATKRALALSQLLSSEEKLATHRQAVDSMKQALMAQVDTQLSESRAHTSQALDQLEKVLSRPQEALPVLEELRTLSDRTWQRISQELWKESPREAPRIRLRELIPLFAASRPFRPTYFVAVAFVLYLLLYSRVYDPAQGAALMGLWVAVAAVVAVVGNGLLVRLTRVAVPVYLAITTAYVLSALPVLALANFAGLDNAFPVRTTVVHAISLLMTISMALPPALVKVQERILHNLETTIDARALEKLHVESQLVVVSQQIANHLHGNVRGNFLASILTLRDHIARDNLKGAQSTIARLRESLLESPAEVAVVPSTDLSEIAQFIDSWSAIVDIALDKPLEDLPDFSISPFHTVVVDAVNNAVRHGNADWIRINFTVEADAIVVSIRNNGNPRGSSRVGLGTTHLDLLAPHQWTRSTNDAGITQLVARLEKANAKPAPLSR